MQRRTRAATGLSNAPARLLVLVLCTAAASAGVQVLQRAGGGAVASAIPGTATPSNTPLANTATPSSTPTDTPVPNTATPSSTPTNTMVPNTATPSSTPTDTPVPNTATPSSTATDTAVPASPTPAATASPTITPTAEVGAALCSDGLDNNLNGLIDCADPSCRAAATCTAEAPAMSPVLVLIGAASLALVGLLQLRRHLR